MVPIQTIFMYSSCWGGDVAEGNRITVVAALWPYGVTGVCSVLFNHATLLVLWKSELCSRLLLYQDDLFLYALRLELAHTIFRVYRSTLVFRRCRLPVMGTRVVQLVRLRICGASWQLFIFVSTIVKWKDLRDCVSAGTGNCFTGGVFSMNRTTGESGIACSMFRVRVVKWRVLVSKSSYSSFSEQIP